MTLAGGFAVLAGLVIVLAMAGSDGKRRALFVALFGVHLAATVAFWLFTFGQPADARRYFTQAELLPYFGISTQFIVFLTAKLRSIFAATYLDAFLFFQIPGIMGILLLYMTAARMAAEEFQVRVVFLAIFTLMPGLQFWTAAIGKDALAVLAYGMISYGLVRKPFDLRLIGPGVLLYFLVRPHVGFIIILAMMLAFLPLLGRTGERARLMGVGALVCTVLLLPFVTLFIGLEETGVEQVTALVERRQGINQSDGSSIDIAQMSVPMRVITFWFRPLFLDAQGALGLAASVENLFLLLVFAGLMLNLKRLMRLLRLSEVLRFHAIFLVIMTLALSQLIGNLGLALRQKMMLVPALFILAAAVIALSNRLRQERRERLRRSLEADALPAE